MLIEYFFSGYLRLPLPRLSSQTPDHLQWFHHYLLHRLAHRQDRREYQEAMNEIERESVSVSSRCIYLFF